MAALQYVDVPGYAALILRRTWQDLSQPGAILDRSKSWLDPTDATPRWGGRTWLFPSGARLVFGYVMYHKDVENYASAEFQFIGIDELSRGWEERTYEFLFSRIRRPAVPCVHCSAPVEKSVDNNESQGDARGVFSDHSDPLGAQEGQLWKHRDPAADERCGQPMPLQSAVDEYRPAADGTTIFTVPLRMRTSSNPGGSGHKWVKERFVDPTTRVPGAVFVPASLQDNPSLDRAEYERSLAHLGPVERARLLRGDWDVIDEGNMFKRYWWNYIDNLEGLPMRGLKICRYWDMGALNPKRVKTGETGDWVVGMLAALSPDGLWYVIDVARQQGTPLMNERFLESVTQSDVAAYGEKVIFRMEQEGASSGLTVIDSMRRSIFKGLDFDGDHPRVSKVERAQAPSSACEAGNIYLLRAPWNSDFVDEAELFPAGPHDDQIDTLSGCFKILRKAAQVSPARATTVAKRRIPGM